MKKILIVDDQSLNQTLLEAYINQYSKQHGEAVTITTANNGIEAVALSQNTQYDLIFMDILMPIMDGIEATKRISAILPNTIIVIVSTEEDEENQIKALRNGAKDYCIKPIQPDVFKHRLELYLSMLNSAKGTLSSKQSHNLFSNTIFCYKTIYLIEDEEDLAQLWESLLFRIKDNVRTNFLSDLIRFIYQLGLSLLSHNLQPEIIMEENEEDFFFSILPIETFPTKNILQMIKNHFETIEYQMESNCLSFKISRDTTPLSAEVSSPSTREIPFNTTYEKEAQILQHFDFMEEDDRNSLELKLGDLSTQFVWMGSNELTEQDVDQITTAFEKISGILMFYIQTNTLGSAIHDLTSIIKKDEEVFIIMASQMSTLCSSFNNDLILWFRSIFYEGAPSIDFMDASIFSNIQMIQSFLEPVDETTLEEGDGFEFF
ncbi:MAG: response regulator [Campylobacterales bacterium]|nr:response regulator [Campylobacterales bacterium]